MNFYQFLIHKYITFNDNIYNHISLVLIISRGTYLKLLNYFIFKYFEYFIFKNKVKIASDC